MQYTTCVKAKDYRDLTLLPEGLELIGKLPGFLGSVSLAVVNLAAALLQLHDVCDYLLHGKLICLNRDRTVDWSDADIVCAMGTIAQVEPVGFEKSGLEKIDNDYCVNLMLAPYNLSDFADGEGRAVHAERIASNAAGVPDPLYQGDLITQQPGMPGERWGGYWVHFPNKGYLTLDASVPPDSSGGFDVPVLHCECEGGRIQAVCKTLHDLTAFGSSKFCKFKILGIPFGKVLCTAATILLWPAVAAALAIAWATADEGAPPTSGEVKAGGALVARGRWVYDAAHSGYNELHAVHSLQHVPVEQCRWELYVGQGYGAKWCALTQQVPPSGSHPYPPLPITPAPVHSSSASSLSPQQQVVWDAQCSPEHRWFIHPDIDGCAP